MDQAAAVQSVVSAAKMVAPVRQTLQRKCACGAGAWVLTGECADCGRKRMLGLGGWRIGAAGDRFEREADRAANEAMRMAPPAPHPPELVARRRSPAPALGGGEPLATEVLAFMEPRFARRFEHVRVHADPQAAELAHAVGARAFAAGDHLFFGRGAYDAGSAAGRRLLAHELAHVAQHDRTPGAAAVIRRTHDSASQPDPIGHAVPTRRDTRTPTSDICPTCICADDEVARLEAARGRAARLLDTAAALLDTPSGTISHLFERTFGSGSATAETVADTAEVFSEAAKFLGKIAVATPEQDGAIHCDQANDTPPCAGGATGFHEGGNIVVCGGPQASGEPGPGALLLNPPQVATQYRVEGTSGSTDQGQAMRQVPDPFATLQAQRLSDTQYAARLVHLLCHEAIHNAVQPGIVDVYRDERLFGYLGKSATKLGVDLSPLALQNPDSLAQFAFQAPELDTSEGASIAEGQAATATSDKLSGKVSVRPLLGRGRARLMLALAEEAIAQAAERVLDLHTQVASLKGGKSDWSYFSPEDREVRELLVTSGEPLAAPDAAAGTRLAALSESFQRLTRLVHDRRLVVGRRFLFDKPAERIEVAIPDWRSFRSMAPGEQLAILVRALLAEEDALKDLDELVLALAMKRGGLGALAVAETKEKR